MNWEALGAIAETVGAIGVIATLGYLAIQVRQNTRAIRAQTYDSYVTQFRDWNQPMRADQAMAERFSNIVENVEHLPAREQRHAIHVLYDFVRLAENLHYQYREGMVAESVWRGWENLFRAYLSAPGLKWYWEKRRDFFGTEFNEWVESLHETAEDAPPRAAGVVPLEPNAGQRPFTDDRTPSGRYWFADTNPFARLDVSYYEPSDYDEVLARGRGFAQPPFRPIIVRRESGLDGRAPTELHGWSKLDYAFGGALRAYHESGKRGARGVPPRRPLAEAESALTDYRSRALRAEAWALFAASREVLQSSA